MSCGKQYRLKRLFNKSGKLFVVALDHGFTLGPIDGIKNIREDLKDIVMAGPDAIIIHKGLVRYLDLNLCVEKNVSVIIHLMGSTDKSLKPNDKRVVCTVEEAIRLGADAVSVHVNIGSETENDMLESVGEISRDCEHWQVPLLGMFYPRGPKVDNPTDKKFVKHAARIAMELNMDVVKTSFTSSETFSEVVKGAEIPVVIAGGSSISDEKLLTMIEAAVKAGGVGVSIGRNIFERPNRAKIINAIAAILHRDSSVEEALKLTFAETVINND
jgi:predicted phospho-2-dehydro-3-deoxyheptonate aldolase